MTTAFDPFNPEFLNDPYPAYHFLRATDPVHWLELPIPEMPGAWLLTRYADVSAVLRDERFSAAKTALINPVADGALDRMLRRSMLVLDPPDHTRLRTLVTRAFTPRVVEALRPRVQALVDAAVEATVERGTMEVIGELAAPLPVTVIAELLGLPSRDRAELKRWSDSLVVVIDDTLAIGGLAAAEQSASELEAYLDAMLAARRARPEDDLLSRLVAVHEAGDALTRDELLGIVMLILIAGHETTTNLIGNGLAALFRHPEALAALQAEPARVSQAIDELLRWDSPVQLTSRQPLVDLEIGGRQIRAGQEVSLLLGAANRDPERFADPDRLQLDRADVRHLAFGQGLHFCLGAALAKLEAQIALTTLLERFRDVRLEAEPVRRPGFVLRALERLEVTFTPPLRPAAYA